MNNELKYLLYFCIKCIAVAYVINIITINAFLICDVYKNIATLNWIAIPITILMTFINYKEK